MYSACSEQVESVADDISALHISKDRQLPKSNPVEVGTRRSGQVWMCTLLTDRDEGGGGNVSSRASKVIPPSFLSRTCTSAYKTSMHDSLSYKYHEIVAQFVPTSGGCTCSVVKQGNTTRQLKGNKGYVLAPPPFSNRYSARFLFIKQRNNGSLTRDLGGGPLAAGIGVVPVSRP